MHQRQDHVLADAPGLCPGLWESSIAGSRSEEWTMSAFPKLHYEIFSNLSLPEQ